MLYPGPILDAPSPGAPASHDQPPEGAHEAPYGEHPAQARDRDRVEGHQQPANEQHERAQGEQQDQITQVERARFSRRRVISSRIALLNTSVPYRSRPISSHVLPLAVVAPRP